MTRLASLSCATLALSGLVFAQNPLFAEVNEALPDGMGQLLGSADFEGDGDIDIFTTTGVFLNERGYFRPGPRMPASLAPTTNYRSVAVGDFTGDGRVDVMFGRIGDTPPGVVLYSAPAVGGPEFVAGPTAIGSATVYELAAADFDNDGDLDVVAAASSSAAPEWELLLNDGVGGFTSAAAGQWPTAQSEASWLAAGDFDGDGWVDVFATSFAGAVWRRNLGGGVFGATQPLPSSVLADTGAVGDFDGDGRDDVFLVSVGGVEVNIAGSPTGPVVGTTSTTGRLGAPPVAADSNGDGFDDLVRGIVEVSGATEGELELRFGSPAGLSPFGVSAGSVSYGYGAPMPFTGLAVFDIEGDGDPDMSVVSGAGAAYQLRDAGSAGFVISQKQVPYGFQSAYAPPADIDGDGDVDLLRATLANGVVMIESYLNDGSGMLAVDSTPAGSFAGFPGVPQWFDLDGDGDLDLWVRPNILGAPNHALLNGGNGVFSLGATVPMAGSSVDVAFGDFTGDQRIDVVVARPSVPAFPPSYRRPVLIEAVPTPTGVAYAAPVEFGNFEFISEIVTVDSESDGDLDLLCIALGFFQFTGPAHLYLNDGAGGFAAQAPFVGTNASRLAVGDLNGDQCDDLVIGDQTWLCQGSSYVMQSTHAQPVGELSLVDLNGDGNLDLFDSSGQWLPGNGLGDLGPADVFVPYGTSGGTNSGVGATAVDIDSDGDLDVFGPRRRAPGHFTIYSNLTRHAARDSLALAGDGVALSVYGQPGELWILATSLPGIGAIPLPPFGTLFLDPISAQVIFFGLVPPSGRAQSFLPLSAATAGFTLSWQAMVGPGLLLTNSFDTPIY